MELKLMQQKTTFLLKDLNTSESWAVSCDSKQKIKYIQTNTEKSQVTNHIKHCTNKRKIEIDVENLNKWSPNLTKAPTHHSILHNILHNPSFTFYGKSEQLDFKK